MDTPYQPTGSGKWIWRQPLRRDVVEFGTLPDQRDARIAQLEAALREVRPYVTGSRLERIIDAVLVPPPEGDMRITHEELPA